MTRRTIIALFVLLNLFACKQKKSNNYATQILGEWKSTRYGIDKKDYAFLNNNFCENKLGYLTRNPGHNPDKNIVTFLGTKTKYEIEGDSLKIFNLSSKTWDRMQILSMVGDTLDVENNNGTFVKYTRVHYKIDTTLSQFDQVVVSASGCFGFCPANNVMVDQAGEITYYGEIYSKKGFYGSKIGTQQFEKIKRGFPLIDLTNLKETYGGGGCGETISVTFIKDHQIIKTIEDFGDQAPTEFVWAYTAVRYLYQQVKLDTLNKLPPAFNIHRLQFGYGNKISHLGQSENFYLWNLLKQAKETNQLVKGKYNLKFEGNHQLLKIETDGQLYQFISKNGNKHTYDIGFNFVKRNPKAMGFKIKNEYDYPY